jgi:hypothetical protein
MLDSPEGVCAGQARFEYPATSVLFSNFESVHVRPTGSFPPAGCASAWATGLSALRRLVGARTNRGPGRPGPRCRSQATMPWGSRMYLRAAPWSKSW